jgi:MerR family transcriptional regulator/heat shock protein HspR
MMDEKEAEVRINLTVAARRCNLATSTVRRYIRRGLVVKPIEEPDLLTLRRIRRLTDLGINLAGVEVILHMRRQIEELQAEKARLEALLERIESQEF